MKKLNVLIVEDHLLTQHMLKLMLKDYASRCDVVENAAEALWQAQSMRYDLIVIDLGLPDHNGFELAEQLTAAGVASTLLGLTSQLDSSCQNHPAAPLFAALLEKPLTEACEIHGVAFSEFLASRVARYD